jgi:hypothetical protein
MQTLQSVLHDIDKTYLGGSADKDREKRLRDELLAVRRGNERYFIVATAVLVAFFVASWVLIFLCRNEPNYLVVILGALGGSVFGCVWAMAKLWQKKVATDFVIAMFEDLPPAEMKHVVRTLLERM